MRRFGALLAALLLAGGLTACGGEAEMQSAQVFAMDTVMILTASGGETEAALKAAEDELYRLDRELSRTRGSSAVSRLNSAPEGAAEVGEELRDLIARALDFSDATGGAFDITLAPVSSAWGFTEDAYRVPAREELEELMAHVGAEHVHLGGWDSGLPGPGDADRSGRHRQGICQRCGGGHLPGERRGPQHGLPGGAMSGSAAGTRRGSPGRSASRTPPARRRRMPMSASCG